MFVALTPAQAKARMGGSFPVVKGSRYRYPAPSNTEAWTRLVNNALKQRQKDMYALSCGKPLPVCPCRRKYEYILWHVSPRSKWKRTIRGKHRAMHGLKVGDPRVVHHKNQETMAFDQTVVQTHCEHHKEHGRICTTVRKQKGLPLIPKRKAPASPKLKKKKATPKTKPKPKSKAKPKPKAKARTKINKKK